MKESDLKLEPGYKKRLADGNLLFIASYELTDTAAESLKRPKGSREIVMGLKYSNGWHQKNTNPSASWYLTDEQYLKLFLRIKDEASFLKVNAFLSEEINAPEDANKLEGLLAKL